MFLDKIGNTPLIPLNRLIPGNRLFIKVEKGNPSGSIKDRAAYFMVLDAEKRGFLNSKQKTIVEPTSGNTGIALSVIGRQKGYKVILTMPSNMSKERIALMKMLGTEVVLTPADEGMKGAIREAERIRDEQGAFMPDQFTNPANVLAHELTTGPELLKDTSYDIDIFVTGIGTGGTITGIGRALRKVLGSKVKIVGVEPETSPVISKGYGGPHGIQGIGAGFVPSILDVELLDEVITVSDQDAVNMVNLLAKKEGFFAGISTGANVKAALLLLERYKTKKVVTIAPDSIDKYLSSFITL